MPHLDRHRRLIQIGRPLPKAPGPGVVPDWRQASPGWIRKALSISQSRSGGGWYVIDAADAISERPRRVQIAGRDLVVWRYENEFRVGPNECPHLGACLHDGRVSDGRIVCPWHALELGHEKHGTWDRFPVHNDGVLVWTRLPGDGEEATDGPVIAMRPPISESLSAVMRMEAACESRDVIQNRLDPWHGVHYHPHSFGTLHVIDQQDDEITVRVTYRVGGIFGVEVDARFHSPEPRTIVMTIVEGDGKGSVVETHATPIASGRTAIIEATIATSDRKGFRFARALSRWIRPRMVSAAKRLWVEDAQYAERLFELRARTKLADPCTTSEHTHRLLAD